MIWGYGNGGSLWSLIMPGNIVKINHSNDHEWYVGDSKMIELIEYLNTVGFKVSHDGNTSIGEKKNVE